MQVEKESLHEILRKYVLRGSYKHIWMTYFSDVPASYFRVWQQIYQNVSRDMLWCECEVEPVMHSSLIVTNALAGKGESNKFVH
jgi:hypothetical protein